MAGLKFMTGLETSSGPGTSQTARSAGEAAFGPGYSGAAADRGGKALLSSSPASWAFWGGVAGLGGLWFVHRSLPAGRRSEFQLVLLMLVLWGPAKGLAKGTLQRISQDATVGGVVDDVARAGVWVLS